MSIFDREAKIEILPVSGTLRVSVQPDVSVFILALEIIGTLIFGGMTLRLWRSSSLLMRALFVWADISGVLGLFYQFSGSEEIEFDSQKLTIRKNIIGWERRREYPIATCSELGWMPAGENRGPRLRCKVGWRTIRFAEYASEKQGTEILVALQEHLPEVFSKMGAGAGFDKPHFTRLGLG